MSDLADYIQRVFIDPTDPVTVAQDDPEELKVEIHQPAAKEEFEVVQPTAADLKATVTQAAKDRTVTCDTPANLKAQIFPGPNAGPIPVGKIPDDGTQVILSGSELNSGSIIHTVDSEKTLYLCHYQVQTVNWSAGVADTYLQVDNASDLHQYYIVRHYMRVDGNILSSHGFFPPLEIPAGYKVRLESDAASCMIFATIHGYEA